MHHELSIVNFRFYSKTLYILFSIPRYEQRLQCLFIITSFKERLDDVATNIQGHF